MRGHRPKRPGHYWLIYNGMCAVVKVMRMDQYDPRYKNIELAFRNPVGSWYVSVRHTDGLSWAGPVPSDMAGCVVIPPDEAEPDELS